MLISGYRGKIALPEKVYVQILKVVCRDYTGEHLKRYLEVHLAGAEYLLELPLALVRTAYGSVCVCGFC